MKNKTKPRLLLVDDEVDIINALTRIFRVDYELTCCHSGEEALAMVNKHDYAVIISDMRMPKMDGATLLAQVNLLKPEIVRILLTGFSDLESTIRAINEGKIYNYVAKPWDNDALKQTVARAVEHSVLKKQLIALNYRLIEQNALLQGNNLILQDNQHLLEEKIKSSSSQLSSNSHQLTQATQKQRLLLQHVLDLISDIIIERTGDKQGHNKRVAFLARMLAETQHLSRVECTQIYLAALMADLGKVVMPDNLIGQPEQNLNASQYHTYQQQVLKGAELLSSLPNLDGVAKIIKHQNEHYSGNGFPAKLKQQDIPIGSRILLIVKDFDGLLLGLKQPQAFNVPQARRKLKTDGESTYDPVLLNAFLSLLVELPNMETGGGDYPLTSNQLKSAMVLAQDVYNLNHSRFLTKHTQMTGELITKIKKFEDAHDHRFVFFVG
jgi:adenylate cyclase